jgi:hypothetical protein
MRKYFLKQFHKISLFTKKTGLSLKIWIFLFFLAAVKIFLVGEQNLTAFANAKHDDQLFIKLAENLLNFKWLGDFNNLTLAKGPFYSMWIAFSSFFHIPLLFSQHLLYIFAILILIIALKPLFAKKWPLVLIFAVIIFNPMNYTDGPATRVTREGIYQPLAILVIAFFIAIMVRIKKNPKNIFFWSLFGGFALSAFWLTREEGVWILSFIVPATVYCLFSTWKEKIAPIEKRMLIYVMPFAILFFLIGTLSAVNYFYYKSFNVVEFKSPEFLDAYGALTRIETSHWMRNIPVSTEQRMLAYNISPAFAELKKQLEGNIGKGWTKISDQNAPSENNGEIKGGWFMWAFRDAVAKAKYYDNGKNALDYYSRLASEINLACEKKELDCYPKRSSMNPPWNPSYNKPLAKNLYKAFLYTIRFEGFNPIPTASVGKVEQLDLFQKMTFEKFSDGSSNSRINILAEIGKYYQLIVPLALVLSFFIFLVKLFKDKFWKDPLWLINLFLLAAISARIILVSLIETTSFPAIGNQYLSPVYAIVLLFTLLNLFSFFSKEEPKLKGK